MKVTTLFAACLLLLTINAQAQEGNDSLYVRRQPEPPKEKWTDRISLGGNFGLSLGRYTNITLAPLVGYRFTDKFMAGGGVSYIYSRIRDVYGNTLEGSVYGGRTFAQYTIIPNFAPRVEYEALAVPYYSYNGEGQRRWIGNPLVGAAVLFPIGRRSNFGITALYNLTDQLNQLYSIYGSPWVIRMGVML